MSKKTDPTISELMARMTAMEAKLYPPPEAPLFREATICHHRLINNLSCAVYFAVLSNGISISRGKELLGFKHIQDFKNWMQHYALQEKEATGVQP